VIFDLLLRSAWTFISTFVILCLLLAAALAVLSDPGGTIVPLFNGIVWVVKIVLGAIALGLLVAVVLGVRHGLKRLRAGAQPTAQEAVHDQSGPRQARHERRQHRASERALDTGDTRSQSHGDEESIDSLLDEFRRDFPEIDFGHSEDYAFESKSGATLSSSKTVIVKNESRETDGKPGKNNRKITITIEGGNGG